MTWPDGPDGDSGPGIGETGSETGDGDATGAGALEGADSGDDTTTGTHTLGPAGPYGPGGGGYGGPGGYVGDDEEEPTSYGERTVEELHDSADELRSGPSYTESMGAGWTIDSDYAGTDLATFVSAALVRALPSRTNPISLFGKYFK